MHALTIHACWKHPSLLLIPLALLVDLGNMGKDNSVNELQQLYLENTIQKK
jgi:hypothetical protein